MRAQVGWLLVLISAVFVLSEDPFKPFSGHKVLRIKPSSHNDVQTLQNLENELQLDFWHLPHTEDGHLDVRVAPEFIEKLKEKLSNMKLEFHEFINDVQLLVDHESRSNRRKKRAVNVADYTSTYLGHSEINEFLSKIASEVPNAELTSIGRSYEGKNTLVIKLGTPGNNKPAIFIDAGFHAREWIAHATAINFIYQLGKNPNNDNQITDLLTKFDFYILPVANPDGYEYSRQSNRLWRKNRRRVGSCYGVDINRNFGFHWDPSAGGSTNPCSDLYAGSGGFSEVESRNIRDFMLSKKPNIKGYLTLHSYGQYWLYPWGYSSTATASDEYLLRLIANDAVDAMSTKPYTIGASAKVLYVAAGGSDDYAKGVAGVPYSYTVELPPTSSPFSNGFIVPTDQISGIAADALKGLIAYSYSVNNQVTNSLSVEPTTTRAPVFIPPSYWPPFFQNVWNYYYGK